jgi:hypothetical protein
MVPSAQARSFTLLEAAGLASLAITTGVVAPAHLNHGDHLAWWVDVLDRVRAECPPGDPTRDDLPDPHESALGHDVVLPQLTAAVRALTTILAPASAPLA